jgi:hypothetical protein
MPLKRFEATWLANGKLHTTETVRSSAEGLADSLAFWWGRDCDDFEIIEIREVAGRG